MKPNLFKIATKELSQDALITWLLQYADKSCDLIDKQLHSCGKELVRQLLQKSIPNFNEDILTVKAGRQWEHIDIWAEVNNKYLIIIEDKTNSGKNNNQLERYKETATQWCSENNYENPICIYLKTGNESKGDLKKIVNEGFEIFRRRDIIGVLNAYPEIDNDILIEFKENLINKENLNNEFAAVNIGDWKPYHYEGFYQVLEQEMDIVNWHYVDNPAGGFWNALLSWTYLDKYPTYLQLEEKKLCFKISTHPHDFEGPMSEHRGTVRNNTSNYIINKAKEIGYAEVKKPSRFGDGVWMTVAVVEREHWLGKADTTVDVTTVVGNLKKYLSFMSDHVGVK